MQNLSYRINSKTFPVDTLSTYLLEPTAVQAPRLRPLADPRWPTVAWAGTRRVAMEANTGMLHMISLASGDHREDYSTEVVQQQCFQLEELHCILTRPLHPG